MDETHPSSLPEPPAVDDAATAAVAVTDPDAPAHSDSRSSSPSPPERDNRADGPDDGDGPHSPFASAEHGPGPSWDAEDSLLSWRLAAALVLVLAVVGVGAYKLFGGSSTETKATAPGGAGGGTSGATIADDFSRSSATGLGQTSSGHTWETPTGTWGTRDNRAYLVQPNASGAGRSMAVVDLQSPNGSVSAKVGTMAAGWGLVFRYRGPMNYWLLVAAPKFGTYNVQRVVDGKAIPVGNTPLAKQEPGTVVALQFQGATVTVLINGATAATVTDDTFDPANPGGNKVGLAVADPAGKAAEFSEFSASRAAAAGATGPAGAGGKAAAGNGGAGNGGAGKPTTTPKPTTTTAGADASENGAQREPSSG